MNRPGFLQRSLARSLLLDVLFDRKARPIFIYAGANMVVGALIYRWLEDWSWLDSFYFVMITLTTIGYGDLHPTTSLTKLITIFYSLNGVAILLMLLGEIQRVRQEQVQNVVGQLHSQDEDEN